jgi:acetyltransferase-like isoleucine patch superfamily enzyme
VRCDDQLIDRQAVSVLRVGVALLVQGPGEGVLASLAAYANAIAGLEAGGMTVPVVLVDATEDAAGAAVLQSSEGAEVLSVASGEPGSQALARGVQVLPPDIEWVVIGTTDTAPVAGALVSLVDAVEGSGPTVVCAERGDPAPYVLARRELVERLLPEGDGMLAPAAALVRRARSEHCPIIPVAGAGVQRHGPADAELQTSLAGVATRVAHPDAVRVGTATYFASGCAVRTWGPDARIEIGGYCSFADDVAILHPGGPLRDMEGGRVIVPLRGAHHMQSASTYPMSSLVPEADYPDALPSTVARDRPLRIGSDVWVGTRALILGPVTVGDGAIIGAGAVVRHDVPPYSVVVGNPQQVTRSRFDANTCERLAAIAWWSWDPTLIRATHRRFLVPGEEFADHFDAGGA